MSDIPFPREASSSAAHTGAIARQPSTMGTNYYGNDYANHQDVPVIERTSTQKAKFSAPGAEAYVAVGTKRTRGLDEPEDKYGPTFDTGDVCSHADPISNIVTRAKRLRISDSTADDRDNELRQYLIIGKNEKKGDPVLQAAISQSVIIPERPSLTGLPEELIINILQELIVSDIMALRRTNKRLAYVTRARVLWITRLCQLLDHIHFSRSPATFLPSQLSTHFLERAVIRPHLFDYRWLRSIACHESPITSKALSTGWSEPEDIRLPILMPGGRWLIAACDDGRPSDSSICLWDLDHGTLKWLPEAQMVAKGRVFSMDMKMDRKGSFAFLVVLSETESVELAANLVHQVDVYKIVFRTEAGTSSFHQIDSFPLDTRRASEVQIYPQHGRVIVDLLDRVLLWDYSPINMCGWVLTSKRRVSHRAAHAITHTHKYLIVADGDESTLRLFNLPPLLFDRPARLRDLVLFMIPPYLCLHLPSFSVSLRFSTDRLVDIATMLEAAKPLTPPVTVQTTTAGITTEVAHLGLNTHQGGHDRMKFCFEPLGRGFLFIDAASCDSYLLCSFPIHEIAFNAGSPNTLSLTSRDRGDAREQARSGSSASSGDSRASVRPFFAPVHMGDRRNSRSSADALWVGEMGGISSVLTRDSNSPRFGTRNVVLMRSPDYDGSLIMLSTMVPPAIDLWPDQSRMAEIEQGVTKTVLRIPLDNSAGTGARGMVRVEEASVDEISGKVCIVETTTVVDRITNQPQVRCGLRVLEYA